MVSTKSSKVTYAERVLGAFTHLQREHRKHDIHVASLRAQIKRHAEAKNDRLGPHWTQWVSKAITKLATEGILEHTVPGTVALTSNGKKAIADARRSLQINSPQKNEDFIWKQIHTTASRGVKRPRKSSASNRDTIDSDSEDETASMAGKKTARKRPRASVAGSPKKSISKLTKSELQHELASVKKAYAIAMRRPSSPLTDLSDDDANQTTELEEKLKERDEVIKNMRRELSLMRNEISREESQAARRSETPGTTLNFDQMSSPIGVPATMSRFRATGVTRTQSGSYIPNLSKQPTPAPSSSERDDDYGQAGIESLNMTIDDNDEVRPNADAQELSMVTALRSEIQDLQKRMAENLVIITSKETKISDLETDRARTHQSVISDRETIANLKEKVSESKTEAINLRESCRLAEETAAQLTLQLQAAETSVIELRAEADASKIKLGALEMSNASLVGDRETMKLGFEQAKAECIEARKIAEDVRNHAKAVSDELHSLKILQEEKNSKIEGLVESLTQTSSDAQALRENSRMLETYVAKYQAEIQMKDEIRQNIETQMKQNDSRIAQLSADLQNAEKSAADMKTRLAEVNRRAADAESLNGKLTIEISLKDGTVQQYQDDLATVQGRYADAQLEATELAIKHANETTALSSTISSLRDALATAKNDVEKLTAQLQTVEDERLSIQEDLGRKGADLLDTLHILEMERKEKLAFKAELTKYTSKTQELEEALGYFKTSKEADEESLRVSFMKLRASQLQAFGEFEQEINRLPCPSVQSPRLKNK